MIKRFFSLAILFIFIANNCVISQVEQINFDVCKAEATKIAAFNKKVKIAQIAFISSFGASIAVASAYFGYKGISWVGGKLFPKPYSCKFDDVNWDEYIKGYNRLFDEENILGRVAALEKDKKSFFDKMVLQTCINIVIQKYGAPVFFALLTPRDIKWACEGLEEEFVNCKSVDALRRGVYFDQELPKDILDIYKEALILHLQKVAGKITVIAAFMISIEQLKSAESLIKTANYSLSYIDENLDNKDFDFIAAITALEKTVDTLKSAFI